MKKHCRSVIDAIRNAIPDPRRGVEVGVWRGHISAGLLAAFPNLHLTMIDPWREWASNETYYQTTQMGKSVQQRWADVYQEAMTVTDFAAIRRAVLRTLSEGAAQHVLPGLDFAFIDGDHTYDAVRQDIELWWPRVKPGGLLLGHDYNGLQDRRGVWGVKRAADEFAAHEGLSLELGSGRVWWTQKPGIQ